MSSMSSELPSIAKILYIDTDIIIKGDINIIFSIIKEDMSNRPHTFGCQDQPYIVYNAFKYNCFNNKILKQYAVNNDYNIHSDKIIHHFPGNPGVYEHKIINMSIFLYYIDRYINFQKELAKYIYIKNKYIDTFDN
jgi:hypothetical protein